MPSILVRSVRRGKSKNHPAAPDPEPLPPIPALAHRGLDQLVIDGARKAGLKLVPHEDVGREASIARGAKAQRVLRARLDAIIEGGLKTEPLVLAPALGIHRNHEEGH